METDDVIKYLEQFEDVFNTAKRKIRQSEHLIASEKRFQTELKIAKKDNQNLQHDLRIANKILFHYEKLYPKKVILCLKCDGDGGFSWQDEGGGGSEECPDCHGMGVIIQGELN